jgi:hypothetical protein
MIKPRPHIINAVVSTVAIALICFFSARDFRSMHEDETLYPSRCLTERKYLSDYFPALKDTPGDTEIFVFEGKQKGGRVLVLGGTHPNEPAGFITAVLLAENIAVHQGTVFIIPRANSSGFTHDDPFEGSPQRFSIPTPGGSRWFRYGSRLTNPVHQWPDPSLYINPTGQKLAGTECRNLNRCYPGRRHGFLTEKIAFGIMELIRSEGIDLAIDMHEAAPEYPVINAIVFHENSAELAALALMELELEGIEIRLEASPPNLKGLSHREWGDHSQTMAILLETANASHGRLKGKTSMALITEGKDKNYAWAARLGLLFVPFGEEGIPLKQRVFRHLSSLRALLSSMNELIPEKAVAVGNLPDPGRIIERGVGPFLGRPEGS